MNRNQRLVFGGATAFLLFAVMAFAVASTEAWQTGNEGTEDIDALVESLFTTNLVAFEVLGVLLTGAMIGALVIARPLATPKDPYARVGDDKLAESQATAALGATFPVAPLPKEEEE